MNTAIRARRARLRLLYEGKDISEDISKDLISATWTDKSAKEVDDLSITLHNKHGRWYGEWLPSKGAKLSAWIVVENWAHASDGYALPCGTFEIDEIEVSSPPSTVTVKAVSMPITAQARGQAKNRAWEDVTLKRIAADIAAEAGLDLIYDKDDDPFYQYEGQHEETDLSFLQGLCAESGASLKVTHDKIVVFDQAKREEMPPVVEITPERLTSHRLRSKSSQVYSSCKVQYHDPETNEEYEYEHKGNLANLSGKDRNGRVLFANKRCKSLAEAENLARNILWDSNKFEVSGSITTMGDIRLNAGVNIRLFGFGRFDGKYMIESATHNIGNGYTTSAEIRRILDRGKSRKAEEQDVAWQDFDEYGEDFYK